MRYSVSPILSALLLLAGCAPQQELKLHYDHPATCLEEALPIGNGRLGALVYGGPQEDRISLNDITLWSGEPDRGAAHPDLLAGQGTDAAATVPLIREALAREDYVEAERLLAPEGLHARVRLESQLSRWSL